MFGKVAQRTRLGVIAFHNSRKTGQRQCDIWQEDGGRRGGDFSSRSWCRIKWIETVRDWSRPEVERI